MTQRPPCIGCGKPLALGKHDVCFSDDQCSNCLLHGRACYRYFLRAELANPSGEGVCLFIMLNPSTADENKPDSTVTKCIGFASRWKYKTVWICNLFAVRGRDPEVALSHSIPVGLDNDRHLVQAAQNADRIVLAWGDAVYDSGMRLARACDVVKVLAMGGCQGKMYQLGGLTECCQPRHPGRLAYKTPCRPFDTGAYLSRSC